MKPTNQSAMHESVIQLIYLGDPTAMHHRLTGPPAQAVTGLANDTVRRGYKNQITVIDQRLRFHAAASVNSICQDFRFFLALAADTHHVQIRLCQAPSQRLTKAPSANEPNA
jgi:hypothetical protein